MECFKKNKGLIKSICFQLIVIFMWGCSPRFKVNSEKKLEETKEHEGFVVLGTKDTFDIGRGEYLGEIRITDPGYPVDCPYETMVKLGEIEARKMGGNIMKMVEYKPKSRFLMPCQKVKGTVYKLPDISPYEKRILWHEKRKLRQIDFKGSTQNRPFDATTVTYIMYEYSGRVYQGKVKFSVSTFFDCGMSYLKGQNEVETLLAHEQGHFDMAELYARKFFKRVAEEAKNVKDLKENLDKIYYDIQKEMQVEQDWYDSDIYPDPAKQVVWLKKLEDDLKKHEKYSKKQAFIPIL